MTKTIQEATENLNKILNEAFYELYKANKRMCFIDANKISCSVLKHFVEATQSNMDSLDKKEPQYLKRWLEER